MVLWCFYRQTLRHVLASLQTALISTQLTFSTTYAQKVFQSAFPLISYPRPLAIARPCADEPWLPLRLMQRPRLTCTNPNKVWPCAVVSRRTIILPAI